MTRMLIVDDEPATLRLLREYLVDVVDEIRGITDSRLAMQALIEFEPDLMMVDLHMPNPDGLELLGQLRGARAAAGFLPVIVLTADSDPSARQTVLDAGADDFLLKPLDRDEVRLRARNLLRTRHLFKEVQRTTGVFPKVKY